MKLNQKENIEPPYHPDNEVLNYVTANRSKEGVSFAKMMVKCGRDGWLSANDLPQHVPMQIGSMVIVDV